MSVIVPVINNNLVGLFHLTSEIIEHIRAEGITMVSDLLKQDEAWLVRLGVDKDRASAIFSDLRREFGLPTGPSSTVAKQGTAHPAVAMGVGQNWSGTIFDR